MRYIINKADLPCTRHAKDRPTKNIYNNQVLEFWKHQQKA